MLNPDSSPEVDPGSGPEETDEIPTTSTKERKANFTGDIKNRMPKEIRSEVEVEKTNLHAPKPLGSHPSFFEMVKEAIVTLKERSGSTEDAIAKYLENRYSADLPLDFKKKLYMQLCKSTIEGKLVKVNRSYKLADESMKAERVGKSSSSSMALKVVRGSHVFKKSAGHPRKKVTVGGAASAIAKARKVVVKAIEAAKLKSVVKSEAETSMNAVLQAAVPRKKTAAATKKAAVAVCAGKKLVTGRNPLMVSHMSTSKRSMKFVKSVSAKAMKPAAKATFATAASPLVKKAKNKEFAIAPKRIAWKGPTTAKNIKAGEKAAIPVKFDGGGDGNRNDNDGGVHSDNDSDDDDDEGEEDEGKYDSGGADGNGCGVQADTDDESESNETGEDCDEEDNDEDYEDYEDDEEDSDEGNEDEKDPERSYDNEEDKDEDDESEENRKGNEDEDCGEDEVDEETESDEEGGRNLTMPIRRRVSEQVQVSGRTTEVRRPR